MVLYRLFEDKVISGRIISINSLSENIGFLIISDEAGEPLYYQNFNYQKIKIAKNEEGKYYRVKKKIKYQHQPLQRERFSFLINFRYHPGDNNIVEIKRRKKTLKL